jgi:4,5-DOPA dioxygenase extradiol
MNFLSTVSFFISLSIMQRRNFIKALSLAAVTMKISDFKIQFGKSSDAIMPVLFVGHGNPMNAIEDNEFSRTWELIGKQLPEPKAILCVSAHWQTEGTRIGAMEKPQTIHDFGGFPKELFDVQYEAKGSPEFARETKEAITKTKAELDYEWGLDHGCWSVLRKMYPQANVPAFQLSLDYNAKPTDHYEIAKQLKELRKKGVLIIGSGNIVHNLRLVKWKDTGFDWAIAFDEKIKSLIEKGDDQSIVNYNELGTEATLSIPTNEHYLPLLYSLAVKDSKDDIIFFNEKVTMGSVSMRSLKIG